MNKDKKKLKKMLGKIPEDASAVKFGHVRVGAIRWYNKDLT